MVAKSRIASWRVVVIAGVLLAVLGVAAVAALWLLFPDQGPSLTTDTRSDEFPTGQARVAFLQRYLKMRTPATDASFHIVYHDNSQGVPGPSDWSIVAAVRVLPGDAAAWLADANPATPADVTRSATAGRPVLPSDWKVASTGGLYVRGGALLIWHPEGVIEFSASTL